MVVVMKTREELIGTGECRNRDHEMVRLVGRHGVMQIEQVQRAMGAGRSVTYRRFGCCEAAGLVERLSIPGVGPILHATRDGIRYAGLPLPVAAVSAGTVEHTLRCASVAIRAGEHYGHDAILTEREILAAEGLEERPIASAQVGTFYGEPKMHRADLAVLREEGTIAIEVELTPKGAGRLGRIISGWVEAILGTGELAEVHYVCSPGQTLRAVERAVAKAGAEERIEIAELSPTKIDSKAIGAVSQ
jgi:hypothetical protein